MLTPHVVGIAVIISSLIASLCFTFAKPFNNIFLFIKSSCALVRGNTNKILQPKDQPIDQASEFTLAHLQLLCILQNSCKNVSRVIEILSKNKCEFSPSKDL